MPPTLQGSLVTLRPLLKTDTSIRYSIIDDEWPQVQSNLERRLSGYRQEK